MDHDYFENLLPLYAAEQLTGSEKEALEIHLGNCLECQADLAMWKAVSREITTENQGILAPAGLAGRVIEQANHHRGLASALKWTWMLLYSQTRLVHGEMWPATAAVMALGVIVALISRHMEAIYFLAPLIAAASLAVLFGEENDPAYELTMATPTSPWKILLARLSVVSAYNFGLVVLAALVFMIFWPTNMVGAMVISWLAPMAFLSALALLLSVWIGTNNAVLITYCLWIFQYIPLSFLDRWISSPFWIKLPVLYQQFWQKPELLFTLALAAAAAALWSTSRSFFRQSPG